MEVLLIVCPCPTFYLFEFEWIVNFPIFSHIVWKHINATEMSSSQNWLESEKAEPGKNECS